MVQHPMITWPNELYASTEEFDAAGIDGVDDDATADALGAELAQLADSARLTKTIIALAK